MVNHKKICKQDFYFYFYSYSYFLTYIHYKYFFLTFIYHLSDVLRRNPSSDNYEKCNNSKVNKLNIGRSKSKF